MSMLDEKEFFDIYDKEGNPTNEIISREEVHQKGLWHRSVHVWIISEKKVLLQKRSLTKESYPGFWDVSAAGHISAGDDPVSTAVREVREELGLSVQKSDLKYLFSVKKQSILNDNTFFDNEINDVFLIDLSLSIYNGQDFFIKNLEVDEIKWVSFAAFRKLVENAVLLVPHKEEYQRLLAQYSFCRTR